MAKQAKTKSKDAKKSGNFFKNAISEIKKITWPTAEEAKKATAAVFIFTLIYTAIIGVFDYGFSQLFELILKVK